MNKTLILMQGIPGSGKSTCARWIANGDPDIFIYSTDEFWGEEDYDFDVKRLGEAHQWNQVRVHTAMKLQNPVIVVDNTNITNKEAAPYFEMAEYYGYTVIVVRIECPLEVALERNAQRKGNRRIPDNVIRQKFGNMEVLTCTTRTTTTD